MHPSIIELREWSRITEDLSAERNRLANRFRHQLWRYYPQLLDVSEDWAAPWMLDLWELIPTPATAQVVRTAKVMKLIKRSQVKRWSAETLLDQLRRTPLAVAPGVTEACILHCRVVIERLRLIAVQLKTAMKELSRLSEAVSDLVIDAVRSPARRAEVLKSIPGVGPVVLATLLSEAHDAVTRCDATALRRLSGVVPVTRRSGKQYLVVMRQACPHRLRTAVFHWARVAVMHDFHSRNRYAALRKRGHSHARALRSIASRLIGVACAMLQTGELFDPNRAPQSAVA